MADIPVTSTTLLRDLTSGPDSLRWEEFVSRYRPVMEAFLRSRFPFLDEEDVIQDTLVAFARALPGYRYVPEEKGYFHNYLTGILRHKAADVVRRRKRRGEVYRRFAEISQDGADDEKERGEDEVWRRSLFEIALQQLMASPDFADRSKEVFVRTAIRGEKPDEVASSLGMTRNAVDQVKWRMMRKIRSLIEDLRLVDGGG